VIVELADFAKLAELTENFILVEIHWTHVKDRPHGKSLNSRKSLNSQRRLPTLWSTSVYTLVMEVHQITSH